MTKVKELLSKIRYSKPVRTAAQTALGVIGTTAVGITDVDWVGVSSAAGLSAVVCLLMALADGSSLSSDPDGTP